MTRKIFAVSLMLCVAALFAFAQEAKQDDKPVKLTGYLIDNMCAGAHEEEAEFGEKVKDHPVGCALMPNCAESGFALVVDKKIYKLDEAGNKLALDIYKAADKKQKGMRVELEGSIGQKNTLHVTRITEVKATE